MRAHLIHYSRMSPSEALDSVWKTRPDIFPKSDNRRALNRPGDANH